jgi:hypothetical protein
VRHVQEEVDHVVAFAGAGRREELVVGVEARQVGRVVGEAHEQDGPRGRHPTVRVAEQLGQVAQVEVGQIADPAVRWKDIGVRHVISSRLRGGRRLPVVGDAGTR